MKGYALVVKDSFAGTTNILYVYSTEAAAKSKKSSEESLDRRYSVRGITYDIFETKVVGFK